MSPRWSPSIRSAMSRRPKRAGSSAASDVAGPRPSSARAAHHSASSARNSPPPQSPEILPTAANRAVRPSGSRPEQLIPAPHTTATPGGASTPARSSANVSFPTNVVAPQRRASNSRSIRSSSIGRSALARQADTCAVQGPAPSTSSPAMSAASRTIGSNAATAAFAPMACGRKPAPRALPRTDPSAPIKTTSVLLLPASIASTRYWPALVVPPVTPTRGSRGCGRSAGR